MFSQCLTIDTPAVNQCINQDQQSWLARLYPPAPFFIAHNLPAPSNPITQIAPESWDALLSANGLILVGIEQTEQWLPQQLNYDLFDAINFEKGCYTGQEVVARLHYRGKTKDRIMSGTIKDVTDHSHLAKVAVESGKTVGRILTSLPLPSGQTLITGVFKTDALHELSRGSSVGSINWIEPKYAIPYE